MASTVWKGQMRFEGFSIPVKLTAAARPDKISFSLVNPATGSGAKQLTVDACTGQEVSRADLVKSAQLDDGRMAYVTEDELKSLKVPTCDAMEVLSCVKVAEVDPVYFDASYHVHPDGKVGDYPYHLMRRALEETKVGALVKLTRGQRESLAVVRPSNGGLMLHTLFYANEVRPMEELEPVPIDPADLKLARSFVRASARAFAPEEYADAYRAELNALLESKAAPGGDLRALLKTAIKTAKATKAVKS